MATFSYRECGRTFPGGEEELVEKAHDHMHVDRGKSQSSGQARTSRRE